MAIPHAVEAQQISGRYLPLRGLAFVGSWLRDRLYRNSHIAAEVSRSIAGSEDDPIHWNIARYSEFKDRRAAFLLHLRGFCDVHILWLAGRQAHCRETGN